MELKSEMLMGPPDGASGRLLVPEMELTQLGEWMRAPRENEKGS